MTRPTLARRTQNIAPFYVMELVKKAKALEAAGAPIIHLSIGEPDFTAPPPVVEALKIAADSGASQYTAAMGIEPLREAIAADYQKRFSLQIDPARILVTAGASAALNLACCALVNPGDGVVMADPGYPCNRHFVSAHDGFAQLAAAGPETGFQLTDDLLRQHWTEQSAGVLLSSPSNPTGTSIPPDQMAAMLGTVRERNGFALVDEIYLGLSYDESARSALTHDDHIIVANSFSKYFNMTGWRLGWLVVPTDTIAGFEKLAQNLYICASALAQQAALACFSDESQAIYAQRRQTFQQRRDYLVPALREIGFDVPVSPDGAFYIYADISRFSDDSNRFTNEVLEQAHVSLVPGADFGQNHPERYVRISYANSMENLRAAVARLKQFVGG